MPRQRHVRPCGAAATATGGDATSVVPATVALQNPHADLHTNRQGEALVEAIVDSSRTHVRERGDLLAFGRRASGRVERVEVNAPGAAPGGQVIEAPR